MDESESTPADYTIMVTNFPTMRDGKHEIKKWAETCAGPDTKFEVVRVNMTYDLDDYFIIEDKKHEAIARK